MKKEFEVMVTVGMIDSMVLDLAKGATEGMIAAEWGISQNTFLKWKNENFELSMAVSRGKAKLLSELHSKAYKKAMGYSVQEVEEVDDPEKGLITKTKTKYIQSDRMIEFLITKAENEIEKEQDRAMKILNLEEKQEKIKMLRNQNKTGAVTFKGFTDVSELKDMAKELLEVKDD